MTVFTSEHKDAMKMSHDQNRAVRLYLQAIEDQKQVKPTRRHNPERLRRDLAEAQASLADASSPMANLEASSKVERLQAKLDRFEQQPEPVDLSSLEADFVQYAAGYAARKQITYAAWLAAGVNRSVLSRAGITRGNSA